MVSVEAKQALVEERSEVLGQLVALLETRPEAVGQRCYVGDVVVLADFGLLLDLGLQLAVVGQQPAEDGFLDLLVVLLLEELVREELHRPQHQQLAALW